MVRLNLEWLDFLFFFSPEQLINWSGQCWGGGGWRRMGDGGRTGIEQQMEMDGDGGSQSASVRGEQTLRWNRAVQAEEGSAGGGGGSQPCLPRGPPCLRRHEPSRVSNAIFTKAWKLLLLSLRLSCEGTQTQIDSFTGDTAHHQTAINHLLPPRLGPARISRLFHR